jgi:aspartate racemase
MKTIGLIGGLSWESTAFYYRYINQGIKARLGGLHSAKCLLYSFDFAEVVQLQEAGQWQEAAALLAEAAVRLEASGCDVVLICTNTMVYGNSASPSGGRQPFAALRYDLPSC